MCISRRAPIKNAADESQKVAVQALRESLKSKIALAQASSSNDECSHELNHTDTDSTASLTSDDVSCTEIVSNVVHGDDSGSTSRAPFMRKRSNSVVSWADDYHQPLEEHEPTHGSPPPREDETSILSEKRKRLVSLRQNIFQRLDSVSSHLHDDFPTTSQPETDSIISAASKSDQPLSSNSSPDTPFESQFEPHEMRCLALVAHDHMKPALFQFIETHRELLSKFRLTGPKDTLEMLHSIYGSQNPCIVPSPVTESQLAVQICLHDVGGAIFFMDPLLTNNDSDTNRDANAIVTMANRHNVLIMSNPTTAVAMSHMLRMALVQGQQELIPSFFANGPSPAIEEYKKRQAICNDVKDTNDAVADSMLDATILMSIYSPTK